MKRTELPEWIDRCPSPAYVLEEAKLRKNLELIDHVQREAGKAIL